MKHKLLFFLICLVIILLIYILIESKNKFYFQISNNTDIVLPLLQPFQLNSFNLNHDHLRRISSYESSLISFSSGEKISSRGIVINYPGIYEIMFTISGSKRIFNLPSDDVILDDENLFVDCFVEWYVNGIKIPVFSDNRTNGPENVNHFTKIFKIDRVPHIINVNYKNLDTRVVENYTLDNFILIVKKL